jgi:hypothetical protein
VSRLSHHKSPQAAAFHLSLWVMGHRALLAVLCALLLCAASGSSSSSIVSRRRVQVNDGRTDAEVSILEIDIGPLQSSASLPSCLRQCASLSCVGRRAIRVTPAGARCQGSPCLFALGGPSLDESDLDPLGRYFQHFSR